jgi:hypothetical protein
MCSRLTANELAERLHVTRRWVLDQTRSKTDPLPHFKRGRVRLFSWFDCADSPLQAWYSRHEVGVDIRDR